MENTNNNQSFYQFSDQLRLQAANLSIWGGGSNSTPNSFASKKTEERRNFDIRVGGERERDPHKGGEFNGFNNGWKIGGGLGVGSGAGVEKHGLNGLNGVEKNIGMNGTFGTSTGADKNYGLNGFNGMNGSGTGADKNYGLNGLNGNGVFHEKNNGLNGNGIGADKNYGLNGVNGNGVFHAPGLEKNNGLNGLNGMNGVNGNGVFHTKYGSNKSGGKKNRKEDDYENRTEKKKNSNNNNNSSSKKDNNDKNSVDKRFKTLPAAEALPRNEVVGGYIFVCNNDTMEENLKRQLFGLPPRYRDSVRAITPGLPLFLYNYSTHQLHGIFQAASFGGTNIDPTAWEDKKCPGESRFPAQVKVATRKICNPLEEDAFRPILHHYDGPKFRLELNIPEALALLDIFADGNP